MFRFAHPYYLLALIPVGAAAWFVYRRRIRQGLLFPTLARLQTATSTWQTRIRLVSPALFTLGLALAILALARPQTVFSRFSRQTNAIAIEMVVDISGSMQALDFSTRDQQRSRIDAVKDTFAKFVALRPDDLIGLVTFGGYAYSRVPLTVDHQALLHTLKGVEVPKSVYDANGQVSNAEELLTAIGDALATACARLQTCDLKSRIIVLLTDGESNTGAVKPEEAVKAAKALGIKVYTIGVGSTGQAPFILRDIFGRDVVQYADVRLDEDLLRRIATATGSKYFNVREPRALEKAMDDINGLEKTKVRQEIYEQYSELFALFLLPALGLILLSASLNVRLMKSIV